MKDILERRAKILRTIRSFFDNEGFIEVETAVRIVAPAPEEHIDCPAVIGGGYLRASPELQMKKLLAEGMEKIYQIGPCFREGELGSRHRPEFTMMEWYRRGEDYLAIRRDLERLLAVLGITAAPKTLTVREAYQQYAGWDPWQEWNQDRFDFDMATKVEAAIKELGGGVFLIDYPPQAASLSKMRGGVAERWEFYYDGMELANCFTELCDGDEQRKRFLHAKANRATFHEADYPLDEEFLSLLPSIGSAAGVALGIDRLVMVLVGANSIGDVRAGE